MALPKVLLADDTPNVLEEIGRLLQDMVDIVALARNGQEALDLADGIDVDLMILDISMPLVDGIQVASRLRERGNKAKVIFVTVHEDPDYIEAARSVGALGYVLKPRLVTDLIPTLQETLAGQMYIASL